MKKIKTISIKDYLTGKGIYFSEKNGELIAKCIFNDCDNDSKGEEAHLYFNSESGQYECKKCGEKGNIFTLVKYLGDDKNKIIIKGKKSTSSKSKKSFPEFVEKCHRQLPNDIREYLYNRGITDDTIERYKIGYGHFYGKNWITIPIKDKSGNYIFLKLREDPSTGDNKSTYPKGNKAQIYGWEILKKNPKYIVICEGELDRLLLLSKKLNAITSTHGANTFKREWIDKLHEIEKIVVCFDN